MRRLRGGYGRALARPDCRQRPVRAKIAPRRVRTGEVVAGWPGLLVDGYDTAVADADSIDSTEGNLLPLVRMDKLAKDVLICIFKGEVKTVDIHQKPEAMHSGVDPFGVDDTEITKDLRNANGELIVGSQISVPWNNPAKRVINFVQLADDGRSAKS